MAVERVEAEPEETEGSTVLVLNSNGGWQPAVLISEDGSQETLSCFDHDDGTLALWACSVNWENQLHIFGGQDAAVTRVQPTNIT